MMAPKNGDIVYITFEYGDPSKPLWEYHGWAQNQIPDILDDPDTMGIVTPNGNRIWLMIKMDHSRCTYMGLLLSMLKAQ